MITAKDAYLSARDGAKTKIEAAILKACGQGFCSTALSEIAEEHRAWLEQHGYTVTNKTTPGGNTYIIVSWSEPK